MKRVLNGKMMLLFLLLAWVLAARLLTGCSLSKDNDKKVRDLEFTVVGDAQIPPELQKIIAEKQGDPFKLTYSNDQSLYIVVGYGKQETGGYSIAVDDLYLTDNSIVLDTELKGPEKGTEGGPGLSYPYIVIKTEYLEEPVIFQ